MRLSLATRTTEALAFSLLQRRCAGMTRTVLLSCRLVNALSLCRSQVLLSCLRPGRSSLPSDR